jgi:arylsulfatase A-like enzyme
MDKNLKNVILLTIDCLRYDSLSEKNTPNIIKFAKNGWFFKRAYSTGCWTTPSMIGLLTSTYPFMYEGQLKIKTPRESIAKILKENGYHTGAFTFQPYLSRIHGFNIGFDDYFDDFKKFRNSQEEIVQRRYGQSEKLFENFSTLYNKFVFLSYLKSKVKNFVYFKYLMKKLEKNLNFYIPSDEINSYFIDWIKNKNEPFFCWLHYLDTHFPYISNSFEKDDMIRLNVQRQKWHRNKNKVNSYDLDKLKIFYNEKVKDVDRNICMLVNNIKKLDKYGNTIFIITADHGEEFYDHGGFHHEIKLYEELIHVPLIVFGKGIKGCIINKVISHIDLFPTILDILGIKKPKGWIGENFILKNNNIAISEEGQKACGDARLSLDYKLNFETKKIAIVWNKWKYIYTERNSEELYDLSNDNEENDNLLNGNINHLNEVIDTARNILKNHLDFIKNSRNYM